MMSDPEAIWFSIYLVTNKINGKRYVGFTAKPWKRRFEEHVEAARAGSRHALHAAIRKYGAANFEIELVESALGLSEAQDREEHLIDHYDTYASGAGTRRGYNMTRGGDEPDVF